MQVFNAITDSGRVTVVLDAHLVIDCKEDCNHCPYLYDCYNAAIGEEVIQIWSPQPQSVSNSDLFEEV